MVLLENDMFLTELTRLFQNSKTSGAVLLTLKRYDGKNKPTPRKGKAPLPEPSEYMCLIRASCRSKKISTIVRQHDVNKFQLAYSSLLKGNMDGLRKLKKVKKSTKATQ